MTAPTIKAVGYMACSTAPLGLVVILSIVGIILNNTVYTESALKLLTALIILEGLLRNPQKSISVATTVWFITFTFYSIHLNTWISLVFIFVSTTILSLHVMTSLERKERLFVILAWIAALVSHLYLCLKEAFIIILPLTVLAYAYALTASYMDIARFYLKRTLTRVQGFYERFEPLVKQLMSVLNRTSASISIVEHINKVSTKIHRYHYYIVKSIFEITKSFPYIISPIEISLDKLNQSTGLLRKVSDIELYINKLTNRVINALLGITVEFTKIESGISSSFHRFVDKVESLQRDIVRSLILILMIASALLLIAILIYTLA